MATVNISSGQRTAVSRPEGSSRKQNSFVHRCDFAATINGAASGTDVYEKKQSNNSSRISNRTTRTCTSSVCTTRTSLTSTRLPLMISPVYGDSHVADASIYFDDIRDCILAAREVKSISPSEIKSRKKTMNPLKKTKSRRKSELHIDAVADDQNDRNNQRAEDTRSTSSSKNSNSLGRIKGKGKEQSIKASCTDQQKNGEKKTKFNPSDEIKFEEDKGKHILEIPTHDDICSASSEEIEEIEAMNFVDALDQTSHGFMNKAPLTTQSVKRSSCYFSALTSYGFIERTAMKPDRIEAFFYSNGMTLSLGILFFAINVIVGAHAASQFTPFGGFVTDSDILRVTLPIARAGGRLVTFNCALLLLTGCKYMCTLIRTYVVPVIPIGFPMDDIMPKYHRFVGLCIIVSGCILHTIPQAINYATGKIWLIKNGGKIWTFGNGIAQTQLLITGSLLLAIFVTFFLTTLKGFRKTAAGFRWFWFFHTGGVALAYPLLIIHGTYKGSPLFLYCAFIPLVIYLLDVILRRSKITKAEVLLWKTHSDKGHNLTELVLKCPQNFVYTPGQYVELKFPTLSNHEWHPFTIASAPNSVIRDCGDTRVLVFFIKATGRWTQALFNYASAFKLSKATQSQEMIIRGPHGAPIVNFSEYKHIMLVGAGVGVTPLLSVWQHLLGEGRSKIEAYHREPSFRYTFQEEDDEKTSKFRSMCHRIEHVLESLTASICLLCISVIGETAVITGTLFGYYWEANMIGSILASGLVLFHSGTILVSIVAYDGGIQYFFRFKCWLESGIVLVDAVNFFIVLPTLTRTNPSDKEISTPLLFGLAGMSVFLHVARTFHVFYTVLRPKTELMEGQKQNHICSVQGIFVNRSYKGMRFAFEQLLQPLEEGLSGAFSLQFYATQEKDKKKTKTMKSLKRGVDASFHGRKLASDWDTSTDNFYCFREGRPDWELIFRKSILKAHFSCTSGDSVGVFFCGNPALSKELNEVADRVSAQHRYSVKKAKGMSCKCKIVVHTENY
ncbi:unnamed protein product [Pseudo-nitzschia multistriata]|uniref:FAD-binding FR-type domain-containing protein n=1 Tax=Pseudo-nitzschia multistriata TaxID=183589 RepID=A0A448Z2Z9_9STRA|nr:unnamed protein product [Pseudo-nitzschia multistriata]